MSGNLFGLPGAEELHDDPHQVAERAWDDGMGPPITIEEWTSKPIRSFLHADNIIDHIIEYDLEEATDPYGRVWDRLQARAVDPSIVALFDAALDALVADLGYRWADEHVATWTATWDPDEDPPEITLTRSEHA